MYTNGGFLCFHVCMLMIYFVCTSTYVSDVLMLLPPSQIEAEV
jgi:hypothetical protein